jgi:hypothetical protein
MAADRNGEEISFESFLTLSLIKVMHREKKTNLYYIFDLISISKSSKLV